MRMLNLKRIRIILGFLLLCFFTLVVSSVYFFDVNNSPNWITAQIKDTTGYDIRFDFVESSWLVDKSFAVSGLSLYQQKKRVLFIDRLDIQVKKLDLWHRQLAMKSIKLSGVDMDIQQALIAEKLSIKGQSQATNQPSGSSDIAWKSFSIDKLEISDLNASVKIQGTSLLLEEANITFNDLLIIEDGLLQKLPASLDFSTKLKTLQVKLQQQKVTFNNLQLASNADLINLQAILELSADKALFEAQELPNLQLNSVDLQLQLAANKLSLQHLSVDVFSGSLTLQADAYFSLALLPVPVIKIKKVDIHSLLAKDMLLNIPEFMTYDNKRSETLKNDPLLIEELWIKVADINNISVHSEVKQLPLTLLSADAQISDYYVIKDAQLLNPAEHKQAAKFTLAFDYLRWQDTVIEQFSMAGDLSEDDPGLQLLKQLGTEH